ncbi:MAG: response regulator [Gammaproteobacteria bacterium]|nr:response regulator [Gammaproteobacteria bacterium]NNJ95598.1 response regulator [Gammaproteobacteria bacterium]
MKLRKVGDAGITIMRNTDLSIIIVDDLQFSRIVVKTALKKAGYGGVRLADSATQAFAMLDEQPADVVLADWMMPEMDGLELTDRIRQRDEELGTYTAIILFTANEGIDLLVQAFEHGVDDYLRKPPNPHELAARVNAAARIAIMQNDLLETSRQLEETIRNLEAVAMIDPLTGAGNRRFLDLQLRSHLLQASSRNEGVCLAVLEIDQLKHIREHNGLDVANEILIGLQRRLRRSVRPMDAIIKLDGDRFAVLMHFTNMDSFKHNSVLRLREGINQRPFKTSDQDINLSVSIGVAYYRGDEEIVSAKEIIKLSTSKLDEAIELGDNSIVY